MTNPKDPVCVAQVFDERVSGDRDDIERLRSRPGITVRDLLADQQAELEALRGVGAQERDEAPRWVFFEWRNALVRVLGPRAYRRLRLDRNRNKILRAEQDSFAGLHIGVVGASVGHGIAVGLALEGLFGTIRLADGDSLELSNLNRLPDSVLDYGLNKTVLAARRIAEIDPYLAVETWTDGVELAAAEAFVAGLDLVIEVCDSLDVKLAVREQARRRRIPVVMVTSDRGTVDVERYDLEPTRVPFHGGANGITAADLAALPAAAKVPFVMNIVGVESLSARMAASMLEIDESLTTWPHLAGDALQAAASAVMAVRMFGQDPKAGLPSGRVHVDIATRLGELAEPQQRPPLPPFPAQGPFRNLAEPRDEVAEIVRAGQLAPSGGNSQPWRFTVRDNSLRVAVDPARSTAMDVGYRASRVALGAAVQNMCIAAAAKGVLGEVVLYPDGVGAGPEAELRLGDGRDAGLAAAYRPMLRRSTNRNLADPTAGIPEQVLDDLRSAASVHGAGLCLATDRDVITELAAILADTDRIRFLIPRLHHEMVDELADPRVDPLDRGLDVRSLELGPGAAMLDLARRADVMAELSDWDLHSDTEVGRSLGGRVGELVESSAALVAVTAAGSAPADDIRAGQAMESVWIAANAAGLGVQPIVPLFLFARDDAELAELAGPYAGRLAGARQRLSELIGMPPTRHIAMLLRMGYMPEPTAISLRDAATAGDTAG
ncbi:MAG: Rv1355c family protein [Mycobacteriaceae bacterium]|nr:Rv1355c family protein [Mycobacteriaceae bacterium]